MAPGQQPTSRSSSRVSLMQQLGLAKFDTRCSFGTRFGQTLLLLMLLVAGFLPSSILTAQNIMRVMTATELYDDHVFVTEMLAEIGDVVHQIQIERGRTTLYLTTNTTANVGALESVLQQRRRVDEAIVSLTQWPETVREQLGTLDVYNASVEAFRHQVDILNVTYVGSLAYYSDINRILISWMQDVINQFSAGDNWSDLYAYHMITLAKEYVGIERARGSVFWNKGFFTPSEFILFTDSELNGQEYYFEAKQFSSIIRNYLTTDTILDLERGIQDMRHVILYNFCEPSVNNATNWFRDMTTYIDAMKVAQGLLAENINRLTAETGHDRVNTTVYTFILFTVELLIFPIYVALACRLVFKVKSTSAMLASKSKKLYKEQKRNREMLGEMYPKSIATKLLEGEPIEPEIFEQATVCFVVMCDFDVIINSCQGNDAIAVVNRIFDVMDDEILKYDVFKVETLEDMFLVVSGVPQRNGVTHVTEIADMCLTLRSRMRSVCLDFLPRAGIQLRFGICTGTIAAGIVGVKMPRYLLFGDTVNMAARMQSTSEALGIHLAPASGSLLQSLSVGYKLKKRERVNVKGKGIMQTFWLLDKTTPFTRWRSLREELY